MMKKKRERIRAFLKHIRLDMVLLVVFAYLALCLICFLLLKKDGSTVSFWDVVGFNLLAVTGNDYEFVDSPWTRVVGIFILILGMP